MVEAAQRLVIQPKRWRPTLLGLAAILLVPISLGVMTIAGPDDWTFDLRTLIFVVPVWIIAAWRLAAAWRRKPIVLTPQGFSRDGGVGFVPWSEIDFFVPEAGTWKIKDPNAAHSWLPDDWRLPRRQLMATLEEWHIRYG